MPNELFIIQQKAFIWILKETDFTESRWMKMNECIEKYENIRVKLFSRTQPSFLEKEVNDFLETHKVKRINFKMNDNVLVAIIQYYIEDDENIEKSLF